MIGNLNTSFITEKSCDIVYQFYNRKIENANDNIFFIGLPKKGKLSFLVSVDVLIRLLKEDLAKIKVNADLRLIEQGEKILFFENKRAEFISFSEKFIHFYVKGYEYFGANRRIGKERQHLPLMYGNYIKKYRGTASSIHKLKDILELVIERRGKLRARDKLFLEDKSSTKLGVPSGLLKSKVLLITGNGRKHIFEKWAKETNIYNESIQTIFGDNLIIEKDLNKFKEYFSVDAIAEREKFNEFAIPKLWDLAKEFSDIEDDILELIYEFERGDYDLDTITDLKEDIKTIYNKDVEILKVLLNVSPNHSFPVPSGVKMIVVDELSVIEDFRNVIKAFAGLKIKVICTYDLNDFSKKNPFPNCSRYFWNRQKIKSISQDIIDNKLFIDHKLNKAAYRYSRQEFSINISDDDGISNLYWKIYRNIKDLDGKENLIKLFWSKVHPLYYLIKNSPNILSNFKSKQVDSLNAELLDVLTEESEIESLFSKFTKMAKAFQNHKKLENGNVLAQTITVGTDEINIPNNEENDNLTFVKKVNSSYNNLIITGIPYKEYNLKIIDSIIRSCLISKIKFLFWQKESVYFLRIINSIEKSDWLEDNEVMRLAEVSDCPIDKTKDEVLKFESDLDLSKFERFDYKEYEGLSRKQSEFYHSRYKVSKGVYSKKSFTVYLKSNKWIYIPNNDKIYYLDASKGTIEQKKGSKINQFDVIVLFNISKRDIREVGSSNENMDAVFEDLEVWSNALIQLFESCNRNYNRLEKTLRRYSTTKERKKANPNRINLMRWLDDNDLTLAPREYNLETILDAAGLIDRKQSVLNASKKISRYERQFKKNIKKEIFKRSNEFSITDDEIISKEVIVNNVSVNVTVCRVMSIDNEVLDIDNSYVKKIL